MKPRKKLGQMLLEAGLLSEEQLNEAVEKSQAAGIKLGRYLANQGTVREEEIAELLGTQLRIQKYEPDRYPIDTSLADVLPLAVAQKYHVVPLETKPHLLILGMLDVTDISALDTIEQMTGKEVEPVICTEREWNQLTSSIYGMYSGMGGLLESVENPEYATDEEQEGAKTEEVQISSLMDMAEGAPVVRMVNWMIAQAVREGASDIHVSPEKNYIQLRFRIDGKLKEVPSPPKSMLLSIISRLKILGNMDIAVSRIPQDGRFTVKMENKEVNVRVSSIPTINGENMVLRLLDVTATTYSLDNLGMSEQDREKIEWMIHRPHGMILSTGPTGSGKTTTLYSILKELNQPDLNIVTVEDPVEYRIGKIRQVQLNSKAGMTFASALRSILRQDPDVVMVGEIRDAETANIAVQAALTGHRVLSTVHTNDAAGAITRLIDMGVEPFLVASVLMVSFAQRLLRRACKHCKKPYESPPKKALDYFGFSEDEPGAEFVKPMGCQNCMHTGYQGRIGIYEVLAIDDTIKDMIVRRASTQEITRSARNEGRLKTLKEDAADKIKAGITTLEEGMAIAAG